MGGGWGEVGCMARESEICNAVFHICSLEKRKKYDFAHKSLLQ